MRPLPLVPLLALALAGCATTQPTPPGPPPSAEAEVPSQLPRNVRPLRYSITIRPDAAALDSRRSPISR